MRDWLAELIAKLEAGQPAATITCTEVLGSAPCTPGSRIVVDEFDACGTIGGGNLEFTAVRQARKLLASSRRCLQQSLPLGPLLAQCCGGRVSLLYERFEPADLAFFRLARASQGQIVTRCHAEDYGKWLINGEEACALLGSDAFEDPVAGGDAGYWREPAGLTRRQVCIFGGGHVGKAIAHILQLLDCDICIVDPRPEVRAELADRFRVISSDDPSHMKDWWRAGAIAIVLTHSHDLDYDWTSAILRRGDASWCGLIGSKTKRNRFLRRLRSDGLSEQSIERLTCPIGLPGYNSKEPGAIAVSVAAQILPLLAVLSPARTGQSCECALPGFPMPMKVAT